ncbi:hypothetical protein [Rhodococcus pyridinivorans]|uniref:hypothetical protein n=1 Tax=Rhodococcus pyridinivorans TaxID=103816 RepID=UPI003AAAD494
MTTRHDSGEVRVTLVREAPVLRDGRRVYRDPETRRSYLFKVDAFEEDWDCGCTPSAARLWTEDDGFDVIDYEHDPMCSEVWHLHRAGLEHILEELNPARSIVEVDLRDGVHEIDATHLCPDCAADVIVRWGDGLVQAIVHSPTCPTGVGGWTPEAAAPSSPSHCQRDARRTELDAYLERLSIAEDSGVQP